MDPRLALALVATLAAVLASGCSRQCGILFPPSGPIGDGGAITFQPVAVGQSEKLTLPIQDSTSYAETITQAQITGLDHGAFQVLTTFPLAVPLDGGSSIVIQFLPSQVGAANAEITLTTDEYMPMDAPLVGTGVAPSGP